MEVALMLRSNWERFYVIFMVLLFITGLSLAVYPYVRTMVSWISSYFPPCRRKRKNGSTRIFGMP